MLQSCSFIFWDYCLLLESGSLIPSYDLLLLKSGSFIFLSIGFIISNFFFLKISDIFWLRQSFIENINLVMKIFGDANFVIERYASSLQSFDFNVFILTLNHFRIKFLDIRSLKGGANLLQHPFGGWLIRSRWSLLWRSTFVRWAHLFNFKNSNIFDKDYSFGFRYAWHRAFSSHLLILDSYKYFIDFSTYYLAFF